jgi:glycosyltransferase involved in cell wall biosynthesis
MRVLYDGAIFALQRAGGINRYAVNLIAHLPPSVRAILLTDRPSDSDLPDCRTVQLWPGGRRRWSRPFESAYPRRQSRGYPQRTINLEADVFHPTYYTLSPSTSLAAHHMPVVLTVYDLIHERFAAMLDPRGEMAAVKRRAIQRADAIVCPSQSAKHDLMEIHGVSEANITVIPLASGLAMLRLYDPDSATSECTAALDRPYYLYVGSRAPYKNFDRTLQALRIVIAKRPDVLLATVGPPLGSRERRRLRQLAMQHHVHDFGQIDDTRLAHLYRNSVGLVYPSLYEGFGIPPLEAMSCGTAVISSNAASLPEVVGDAAMVFDPYDIEYLAALMMLLLDSPTTRRQLIERGYRQAGRFSWAQTARQTHTVYQSLAGRVLHEAASGEPLLRAA